MSYVMELRKLVGQRPVILVGATVVVRDARGQVLMQQRSDNGEWGLPGGAMELGESLEETARREVWEETGVRLEELTFVTLLSGPEFFYTYPNGDPVYNVSAIYTAIVDQVEPHPDGVESLKAAFLPFEQLPVPRGEGIYKAVYDLLLQP